MEDGLGRATSSACSTPAFIRLGDTLCTGAPSCAIEDIPAVRPRILLPRQPRGQHEAQAVPEGRYPACRRRARSRPSCAPTSAARNSWSGVVGVLAVGRAGAPAENASIGREIVMREPALPLRPLGGQDPQADVTGLAADLHHRPCAWTARGRDVLLFENEWSIRLACENNEGLVLAETANRL